MYELYNIFLSAYENNIIIFTILWYQLLLIVKYNILNSHINNEIILCTLFVKQKLISCINSHNFKNSIENLRK